MIYGQTEVETLQLNGWGVGDILEGDEGYGPQRILITAIGEDKFICKWDYKCNGEYAEESGNTTLTHREWKLVDSVELPLTSRLAEALRIASKYLDDNAHPTHCEHDTLYLVLHPSKVSSIDIDKLNSLGFTRDTEFFTSNLFGSA